MCLLRRDLANIKALIPVVGHIGASLSEMALHGKHFFIRRELAAVDAGDIHFPICLAVVAGVT